MTAIIVTGSRHLRDTTRMHYALLTYCAPGTIIVHGGAPGADTIAENWAVQN